VDDQLDQLSGIRNCGPVHEMYCVIIPALATLGSNAFTS
jgi:hypothetical protein